MYNAKNYTEQGGAVTHIGGELKFDEGAVLKGGLLPNQELVTGSQVKDVKEAFNLLITEMKNAGLMKADTFTTAVSNTVNDPEAGHADRTYNTSKITGASIDEDVITITLSEKVKDLKDFDGGGSWGVHKWLGFAVSAGIDPITGLYFNGTQLTAEDVTEATAVGLSDGQFVLWVKAERIIQGLSNHLTLWADGYEETEYTLKIVEPAES